MSICRARLRNTSNALTLRMSSEQNTSSSYWNNRGEEKERIRKGRGRKKNWGQEKEKSGINHQYSGLCLPFLDSDNCESEDHQLQMIIWYVLQTPPPSARQHSSYGDCLEVTREYYQNSSVLDCVTQCSQSTAHLCEQFLQVKQIGFVTLGPLRCA